jgi:hypothetical protein
MKGEVTALDGVKGGGRTDPNSIRHVLVILHPHAVVVEVATLDEVLLQLGL